MIYFYCKYDSYGQRTGLYESIELTQDQVYTDRHGNLHHNGHFLYTNESDVIIACLN